MKKTFIGLAVLAALTGCGGGGDKVSNATLEEQKTIARENAMFNAQQFRAADPRLASFQIVSNGDSTQTVSCPQGDGWATLKFVPLGGGASVGVKCSTYSQGTGCLADAEFAKKTVYASQNDHCAEDVPFPLPKIAK